MEKSYADQVLWGFACVVKQFVEAPANRQDYYAREVYFFKRHFVILFVIYLLFMKIEILDINRDNDIAQCYI